MMTFTNWLTQAFATFSTDTFFYTERLAAFKKLGQPALFSSQKENYRTLRAFLAALIDHPYHFNRPNIPDRPLLPSPKSSYVPDNQSVTLTFVDGIWSPKSDLHQGIALQRVADLPFPRQQELWSSFMVDMGVSDDPSGDLFILLNQMLSQESYLLEVEPDRQANIVLQHIITDSERHIIPQLMVKIGSASQVTLLENWCMAGTNLQPFVNNATHIVLEKRARLDYHTLYTDCPSLHQVNHLYCTQKDHTTFTHHNFSFGAAMIHMNLRVHINGSHASAALYGLSTLYGTENVAHQIQVVHSAPNSLSKQHYKSILGGQSTSGFSGKIYLIPAAQQTNAYQTNNVLILSDAAYHYTKPQLEIYADDVKCSHGATAGQLDEEQLFYLQARGIALPLAQRLLLEAFGSEIIHSLSSAKLQAYLSDKLVAKLVKL